MKKFSELEDKDFNYLNTDNINIISYLLHAYDVTEYNIEVERLEKEIQYIKSGSGNKIIAASFKMSFEGYNVERRDITNIINNKELKEFRKYIYILDNYNTNEIREIIELGGNINIGVQLMFMNKTIYVNEQFYYLRKYYNFIKGTKVIYNGDYSWLGKLYTGKISDQSIGYLKINCLVPTYIEDCKIKTLEVTDRFNCVIDGCRIGKLHIKAKNMNVLSFITDCKIDEMIIDFTDCEITEDRILNHYLRNEIGIIRVISTKDKFDEIKRIYYKSRENDITKWESINEKIEYTIKEEVYEEIQ